VAAALAHFARAPGNDRAALAACLRRPNPPLTEAEVAAIRARVLVVLGDRDFAGPADRLVAALPDVRLVILPGNRPFRDAAGLPLRSGRARLPVPRRSRQRQAGVGGAAGAPGCRGGPNRVGTM